MRYIFSRPFTWEEEFQLACMVWITFLAAPAAFRTKSHVAIEILVDALPKKIRKGIELLIPVIVYAVLIYFLFRSKDYINVMLRTNRKTPILMIPYAWIYAIAPVSIVLMLISYTEEKYYELKELFKDGGKGENVLIQLLVLWRSFSLPCCFLKFRYLWQCLELPLFILY